MPKIFYHRISEGFYGLSNIPGVEGYTKRALVVADSDDFVILDWHEGMEFPPPELELLNKQGIGPKLENVLVARFDHTQPWGKNVKRNQELINKLKDSDADALLPFTGMSVICQKLAEETKIPLRSAPKDECIWGNSKLTFQKLGNELGCIPRGIVCNTKDDIIQAWHTLAKLSDFSGKAVAKAAQSASGFGSSVARSVEELTKFLDTQDIESWGGASLQEWIESDIRSPSINYYLRPDGIKEFFITDQLFEGETKYGVEGTRVHRGNRFPCSFPPKVKKEIRKKANPLAKEFVKGGYFGPLGFDSIVTLDGQVYLVEANARITGPHYGWRPMEKVEAKAFRLQNESFAKEVSMQALEDTLGKLLFSPTRASGYVIFNKYPKKFTGVVLADSPEDRDELAEEIDVCLGKLR